MARFTSALALSRRLSSCTERERERERGELVEFVALRNHGILNDRILSGAARRVLADSRGGLARMNSGTRDEQTKEGESGGRSRDRK